MAPSPGQKRARPDEPPTPTSRINPRPPVYTKSCDVPLDFPLAALPDLVMCQALVHHNVAFSAPCAWFPGVSATLDGVVRLHLVSCHKISQGPRRLKDRRNGQSTMHLYSGNRGNPLYANLESRMGHRLSTPNPIEHERVR